MAIFNSYVSLPKGICFRWSKSSPKFGLHHCAEFLPTQGAKCLASSAQKKTPRSRKTQRRKSRESNSPIWTQNKDALHHFTIQPLQTSSWTIIEPKNDNFQEKKTAFRATLFSRIGFPAYSHGWNCFETQIKDLLLIVNCWYQLISRK